MKIKNWLEKNKYYRSLRNFVHRKINHCKAKSYNRNKDLIIQSIVSKERLNIIFFIHSLAYWKYDGLVRLLKHNRRFNFVLIPFINPTQDKNLSLKFQEEVLNYCEQENLPYYKGYNFDTEEFENLDHLSPDIIFYTHPYNVGYKGWLIDRFKTKCLFFYTPYGISLTKGAYFYDTYLTNVAHKIFVGSRLEESEFKKYYKSSDQKYAITGFPIYDDIVNARNEDNIWPKDIRKRIIWAPHHSVDSKLSFSSSNFERICDDMIRIAEKYKEKIVVAFKPHPLLKTRLYDKWGRDKTEDYFEQWKCMDNTFICSSSYAELFAHSDAIIHDCASFACEYLLTGKPAFYICKGERPKAGIDNDFGLRCFKHHYHGYEISDIEHFIDDIILGNDQKKFERDSFVKTWLLPPKNQTVAENIYAEMINIFNNEK